MDADKDEDTGVNVTIEVVEAGAAESRKSEGDNEKEGKEQESEKEEVDRGALDHPPGILKKHASYDMALEHVPESKSTEIDIKTGKEKLKTKKIPPWKLFRYADCWDIIMIIVGAIMACAAGIGLPGHMLLFGNVINNFVYHGLALNISSRLPPNFNCTTTAVRQNPQLLMQFSGLDNNSEPAYFCAATDESSASQQIFSNVLFYVCDPGATLQQEVGRYSIYYVILATGVLIAIFFATMFWNISAYRQTRRIRRAFYRSILRQEIGWFDVINAAQLSTRLADDIEKIQAGIGDKMALFLQYFSTFIAGFVIAFSINWKLALVVSCMLPIITAMAFSSAKIISSFAVREQSAYASAGAVAEEVLSSIRTVVAFGGERKEAERYGEQLKQARNVGIRKGLFTSFLVGGIYFVIFSTYALAFWYGSTLIVGCEISAGDVVTAFFAVIIGSFSLGNALPDIETIATALGAAAVVYDIIDREPEIDWSLDEGEVPDNLEGNIQFSDVVFRYPARPDVPILKGVDLQVKKGQTVALVGPSGCGKSTVVQLLQRFYNPAAGQITIDGREIRTLNLKWLRSNIGIVSQEPVLFNTTILENIRYGREDATLEEVQMAARNANAHDFISKLPDGYNTDVGERGAQLSGGQKQRIAIARALVRDPKILLLDEATSALDTESEKIVQDALDKAREGRTTIVIAHRLSTIQTADIIVAIDSGRVVESGTHAELMDKEGLYHDLVTAQTIAEEELSSSEPLADFRAAVKRSISRQKSSSSDHGRPSYHRSESTTSQGKTGRSPFFSRQSSSDYPAPDFSDHLSRMSMEDIPIASHPSPFPGRSAFIGVDDVLVDGDGDEFEVEGIEEVEEEIEQSESTESHKKKRSRKRLIGRRHREKEEGLPKLSFLELLKLNLPDWPLVLLGVVTSAIIGGLFPLMSILFSEVLRIFGLTDTAQIESEVKVIVGGFVGLAVGASIIYFTATFSLAIAGERLTKRLRLESFKAMLRQEISWFDNKANSTGALSTRLATDASLVKGATGIRIGSILQIFFGLIVAIVIAFEASWELTLVLIFCFPVMALTSYFQIRLLRGRAQKNKKKLEQSGQTAVESIDNMRTVAGLGVEEKFLDRYYSLLEGPFRDNIKSVFIQALVVSIAQSLVFYLYGAGYSFGAFLVVQQRNTYDDIFQVFAAIVFTAFSIGRAGSFAADATKAQNSAARITALLRRKPLIDVTSDEGIKLESTDGAIAAQSVHFNYPSRPDVKVLQGLTVSVKPGQTLALVGPSGCGKSTIVSLVERFYDPVSGNVTLENTDLRDLNLRWLRSQIGIVSQEPLLFDSSIAENIRYGALFREVSDAEVIEAAKAANIHNFIDSLPQGYKTNVGSKGTQLSGGQKQRIAIARALVRDPKILLLDEATSALDTESEKIVQDALDKAREGRTSIVIAHRLSTIYNSDVIAVIHNGQVIESGTHSELMALGGAYYHLNTVQLSDDVF